VVPEETKVLLVDGIGKLTSLYAYADLAYVGGGFGTGIHNILEAATYGIPVIFGPKNEKFVEAIELKQRGGAFEIKNFDELNSLLKTLMQDPDKRESAGAVSSLYVQENKGATQSIINSIEELLKD
jgi:3-deoxy-D-manno-octulosonic-acid transferase